MNRRSVQNLAHNIRVAEEEVAKEYWSDPEACEAKLMIEKASVSVASTITNAIMIFGIALMCEIEHMLYVKDAALPSVSASALVTIHICNIILARAIPIIAVIVITIKTRNDNFKREVIKCKEERIRLLKEMMY